MSYDYKVHDSITITSQGVEKLLHEKELYSPYELLDYLESEYGYTEVVYIEMEDTPELHIQVFNPRNHCFDYDILRVADRLKGLQAYVKETEFTITDEFGRKVILTFQPDGKIKQEQEF